MKVLHAFQTPEQAHLAVSFLENAGIEAYVWDENVSTLLPMFNPTIGMIRVAVDETQYDVATEKLADYLEQFK